MVEAIHPEMRTKMENQENTASLIIKDQALLYIELGWSVIPVGNDKKPLVKWQQYQTKLPSKNEVIDWFDKYPKANIAIVTGKISGIMVVDIDPRNGGSDQDFKLIKTLIASTGGGGYHYYFKYEPHIKNLKNIKPGIDLKTEGGYVIAPPSIHLSGNLYRWVSPPSIKLLDILPSFIHEWVELTEYENNPIQNNSNKYKGVSAGSRNNTASSVIGKLLASLKSEEWENTAWPLFQGWNSRNEPPLDETELKEIFESISKRELDQRNKDKHKPELIESKLTYQEVEEKVLRLLPNSQTALKIVLSVAVSACYQNQVMLWMLLVGVPSSGKTDLVRLIKDSSVSYYLDNLTQNAFISGERATKSNKVHDLLPEIDKKCLVIKDWTAVLSLDEKMTKKLLGDMVGIYDKEFTKFSSRRGNISYASAFSQLGCITPATLNKHTNYMNMVGPRFLCYTIPQTSEDAQDTSYKLIFANANRSIVEKEARLYVSSYLNQISQMSCEIELRSKAIQSYLKSAAKLMSYCRGIVILQSSSFKNDEGEDVKYYEVLDVQVEEPWRAVQQLISLTKYLAFVCGKSEIDETELQIIREVVISSMPADRSQALRVLIRHNGSITAKELSELSDKSTKTARRLLDELSALKVVEKDRGSGTIANDYRIAYQFKDFLLLDPREFMSTYSSGTEKLDSIEEIQKLFS